MKCVITCICDKVYLSCSDYEEVETVPGMAIIGGPLEPSPSTTTNIDGAPDDCSFVNFFSVLLMTGISFSFM